MSAIAARRSLDRRQGIRVRRGLAYAARSTRSVSCTNASVARPASRRCRGSRAGSRSPRARRRQHAHRRRSVGTAARAGSRATPARPTTLPDAGQRPCPTAWRSRGAAIVSVHRPAASSGDSKPPPHRCVSRARDAAACEREHHAARPARPLDASSTRRRSMRRRGRALARVTRRMNAGAALGAATRCSSALLQLASRQQPQQKRAQRERTSSQSALGAGSATNCSATSASGSSRATACRSRSALAAGACA